MKVIVTDLDKTLLRSDRSISRYTESVFQEGRKKGIYIAVATARPERSILRYRNQIPFDAAVVLNGAKIELADQSIENVIRLSNGERIIAELLRIPDVMISVETGDGLFASVDRPEWGARFYGGFPKLPSHKALYKILASSDGELTENQVRGVLNQEVYCTVANRNLYQIMSIEATKWNGIRTMLKSLDISENEVVYFGDDNDDLEPIRECGMGVAVSNANSEILAAARYVAQSNDDDGVARFIEKYIL